MADIWMPISVQTCTCACGTVFRAKAKFVGGDVPGLHTDRDCPGCGQPCRIVGASSDPETMTFGTNSGRTEGGRA